MISGSKAFIWTPIYAMLIVSMLFWTSYRVIAMVFEWLPLVLFAYVIPAFLAHPDWRAVRHSTFRHISNAWRSRSGRRGSYAVTEASAWRGTLGEKLRLAIKFLCGCGSSDGARSGAQLAAVAMFATL
jgi:hypothetical protein